MEMVVQYNHRSEAYLMEFNSGKREFRRFIDNVSDVIGVDYPVTLTAPVLQNMQTTNIVRVLLDQVFFVVFLTVVILSAILIYNLSSFEVLI